MTTRIEPSSHPIHDDDVVLPDGRRLRYAQWGQPDGKPVLLVSTSPGSRLLCPDLAATEHAGVRLITVDRPGSGGSDPHPQPTMKAWGGQRRGAARPPRRRAGGRRGLVRGRPLRLGRCGAVP